MKFFKVMSKKEILNWKRAAVLGFYTYMLTTAVNYFSYLLIERELLPIPAIFWSGLVAAFGYDAFLQLIDRRKSRCNAPDN